MKSSPTTSLNLPTDLYSERSLLGALVQYGVPVMDTVRTVIEPDDFSSQAHRDIWGACCACYDARQEIDATGVYYRLREIGRAESAGGLSYLADIMIGTIQNVSREVESLKRAGRARQLMIICDNAVRRCADEDPQELQEWILHEIESLGMATESKVESSREIIDQIGVDELVCPSKHRGGLRLPWDKLQNALDGMRGGQMIVIAAYTSRGKSSFACQVAAHVTRQGTGAYYWSTEMSAEALLRRMIYQMGGIDGIRHRASMLNYEEISRAKNAVSWFYDNPVWFDASSRTVAAALANMRQVQSKHKIGILIVDHLQHVKGAGRFDNNRTREVADVSRCLKMAALDLDIPVLVVSQVSRPKEEGTTLGLHMLKESGDVENDADVVLLLNSAKLAGTAPVAITLNIAKQREGPAGFDVPLVFKPSSQSFESLED